MPSNDEFLISSLRGTYKKWHLKKKNEICDKKKETKNDNKKHFFNLPDWQSDITSILNAQMFSSKT